jgi:hypothetical protein
VSVKDDCIVAKPLVLGAMDNMVKVWSMSGYRHLVGLYTLNPAVTHSLKAPGFNP